jgi:hypothetical protein
MAGQYIAAFLRTRAGKSPPLETLETAAAEPIGGSAGGL